LGLFSWVPTALSTPKVAPGEEAATSSIDVEAYIPSSEDDHGGKDFTLYFSFLTPSDDLHPANILWDPRMGLDYDVPDPSFCIASLCGGAAVGIIIGAVLVVVLVVIGAVVFFRKRSGYQAVN
jgi:hypothetical protein